MDINLMDFIMEESLILIPVLYILGLMLKSSKHIKDHLIPWVLLVIGIGGSVALNGLTAYAVLQGVLVTGAAVYTNQLVKQSTVKNKEDNQ